MATAIHQQHPPAQHGGHIPPSQVTPRLSPHLPLHVPQPRPAHSAPPLPLAQDSTLAGQPSPPPGQILAPPQGALMLQNGNSQPLGPPQSSYSKPAVDVSRDREPDSAVLSGSSGGSERKRPRVVMEDASIVVSEDRNDWYYPAAPRPDAVAGLDEFDLDAASSTGNWGNKLTKGARWVRRGQMMAWAPGRTEWEMEDRARKRLKRLLKEQMPPSSPPLPTLPHLRSPTPPLTAPYAVPPKEYTSYTSFLVDPSVQHTYTNNVVASLERTATEFIEGEGALRTALGALWQACAKDYPLRVKADSPEPSPNSNAEPKETKGVIHHSTGAEPEARMHSPASSATVNAENTLMASLCGLRRLFVSAEDFMVTPDVQMGPASQAQNFEWAVDILRELYDDTREYMDRLDELRELSGAAEASKKEVWKLIKERALEEMEGQDSQGEDDGVDDGSDY